MAKYDKNKIAGMFKGDDIICGDCLSSEDLGKADQNSLIFKDEVKKEEHMYLCSLCGKKLGW